MIIHKTLFLCGFLLASSTWGSDHLIFIGAGGEKPKEGTIFDDAIKTVGEYVKDSPNLKVDIALNGGHPRTERIINESFPSISSKSNFLETDYQRLINSYKSIIKNEMVNGDQLMIYIDSHGAQQQKGFKAHKIATSAGTATNLNNLDGATLVDLDELKVLKKLAQDKGVKLAIIDSSCHSGASLDLADDNTCVISATGPNHYGYAGFSQRFATAMKKGKNLEDIFLETRSGDNTPDLPMISTKAGLEINSLLYEKITPFLYSFDNDGDKLTPFLREHSSDREQCIADQNFNSLIATINSIEDLNIVSTKILTWTTSTKEIDLTNLKRLLEKYKKSLDLARTKVRELKTDRLNKEEVFKINISANGYVVNLDYAYSWKDLITTDFESLISMEQGRIDREKDPIERTSHMATKALYTQAKAKKEELIRTQPDLRTLDSKEDSIRFLVDSSYSTAREIATEERRLYSALYKIKQQNQSLTQSNPCRDFKIR